ncbi:MAG: hypothetical protein M1814_003294 [Vezdaea aestivalis]|nr:MAG: hypothetical protein M1814_003294 [Vezdaea aestivalis]
MASERVSSAPKSMLGSLALVKRHDETTNPVIIDLIEQDSEAISSTALAATRAVEIAADAVKVAEYKDKLYHKLPANFTDAHKLSVRKDLVRSTGTARRAIMRAGWTAVGHYRGDEEDEDEDGEESEDDDGDDSDSVWDEQGETDFEKLIASRTERFTGIPYHEYPGRPVIANLQALEQFLRTRVKDSTAEAVQAEKDVKKAKNQLDTHRGTTDEEAGQNVCQEKGKGEEFRKMIADEQDARARRKEARAKRNQRKAEEEAEMAELRNECKDEDLDFVLDEDEDVGVSNENEVFGTVQLWQTMSTLVSDFLEVGDTSAKALTSTMLEDNAILVNKRAREAAIMEVHALEELKTAENTVKAAKSDSDRVRAENNLEEALANVESAKAFARDAVEEKLEDSKVREILCRTVGIEDPIKKAREEKRKRAEEDEKKRHEREKDLVDDEDVELPDDETLLRILKVQTHLSKDKDKWPEDVTGRLEAMFEDRKKKLEQEARASEAKVAQSKRMLEMTRRSLDSIYAEGNDGAIVEAKEILDELEKNLETIEKEAKDHTDGRKWAESERTRWQKRQARGKGTEMDIDIVGREREKEAEARKREESVERKRKAEEDSKRMAEEEAKRKAERDIIWKKVEEEDARTLPEREHHNELMQRWHLQHLRDTGEPDSPLQADMRREFKKKDRLAGISVSPDPEEQLLEYTLQGPIYKKKDKEDNKRKRAEEEEEEEPEESDSELEYEYTGGNKSNESVPWYTNERPKSFYDPPAPVWSPPKPARKPRAPRRKKRPPKSKQH